jgi:hypothetical protein
MKLQFDPDQPFQIDAVAAVSTPIPTRVVLPV